ncbi:MAG: hypothetical protein IJK07_01170 [Bacteroidales bacterium]|nr:hypothetical protein [Bacteroidales bacterium]
MNRFQIIVEGTADKKFFEDYYRHLFHENAPEGSITLPIKDDKTGGYQKLFSENGINTLKEGMDYGATNLVIFDADDDIEARRKELLSIRDNYGVDFELFLLPNNQDAGSSEDLLEHIINPNNQPIFECWQHYEDELVQQEIPGRTPPPLTTPAKKTKIYGYLEALLEPKQKDLIKERNRNYENTQHWNLDAEYLEPLKQFILQCFNFYK